MEDRTHFGLRLLNLLFKMGTLERKSPSSFTTGPGVYASYMLGALALLNQTDHSAVFGAQVFEIGDEFLDIDHHIWWDSDGLDDDGLDPLFGEYNWKWGGESTRNLPETISTFKVLDEMIETLRDPELYPILERILVAGHSAGGQIVQRINLVDDDPTKIPIEYFVANPSSAVYLSPERPVLPPSSTKTCSSFCDNFTIPETIYEFAVPPHLLTLNVVEKEVLIIRMATA